MKVIFETSDKANKRTHKKFIEFSKVLSLIILLGDIGLSFKCLELAELCITLGYLGELNFLIVLIGMFNTATGYVLGKYFKKSQAENTAGGIKYDSVIKQDIPRDC